MMAATPTEATLVILRRISLTASGTAYASPDSGRATARAGDDHEGKKVLQTR